MENQTNDTQEITEEERLANKKMQIKLSCRKSYLRNRRNIDISNWTDEEIMNYRAIEIPLDENGNRPENMKSIYNQRYNKKSRVREYYRNYYHTHIQRIDCPVCQKSYVNSGTFERHLRGVRNEQCRLELDYTLPILEDVK
jgi:hypothetical protein